MKKQIDSEVRPAGGKPMSLLDEILANDETILVWLIHGTWARQAKWTAEGSALREALEAQFPGRIEFRTFPWSGRNRDLDRGEAAANLVEEIGKARAEYRGKAKTFVIAHSHGGNVATAAALRAEGFIDGVITINTPFLQWLPRSYHSLILQVLGLTATIDLLILWFAPIHPTLKLLLHAVGPLAIFALLYLLHNRIVNWLEAYAKKNVTLSEAYHHKVRSRQRALCVVTAGDEAFEGLTALEAIVNLPYLMLHLVSFVAVSLAIVALHAILQFDFARPVTELYFFLMLEFPLSGSARYVLDRYHDLNSSALHAISGYMWKASSIAQLSFLVAYSSLFYLTVLWFVTAASALLVNLAVRTIAFGTDVGRNALVFSASHRLHVSVTPMVGTAHDIFVVQATGLGLMRHSEAYNAPMPLHYMGQWIRSRLVELKIEAMDFED